MTDEAMKGEIQWSKEGLFGALERWMELKDTPHDDWDRRERGLYLVGEERTSRIRFNPDHIENQMAFWIQEQYADQGQEVAGSHLWRWMQVRGFLSRHHRRCEEVDLILTSSEGKEAGISEALIEVLATEPYTYPFEEGGKTYWDFDVDQVLQKAVALHNQEKDTEE